jgi:hypothetical protein
MPTIWERFGSRTWSQGDNPSFEILYAVAGTDDETEVRTLVNATAPTSYFDLALEGTSAEQIGPLDWHATARYAYPGSEPEYTFEIAGTSIHITHSIATIATYPAPGFIAPNFQNGINVTHEAVEGMDLEWPEFSFSETHYLDDALITPAYKTILRNLCKCTNDATFKSWPTGEVRLLGVSGSKRGSLDKWAMTYRFKVSENATGLVVGPITGIAKKGWEYMWVRTMEFEDASAKMLVKRPVCALVEQVYPSGDYSLIGIGT